MDQKTESSSGGKPLFMRDLIPEAQEILGGTVRSLRETLMSGVINWGFEVIKHLAIFNGAGLAGATAIAQASGSSAGAHAIALQSAHLFVVGLAIALITMVTIYFTGIGYLRYFIDRSTAMLLNTLPITGINPPTVFWVSVGVNWCLAAASIVTFFAGALKIIAVA